jgi:hypothetical protein
VAYLTLAAVFLIFSIQLGYERALSDSVRASIIERIVLQGHVWYGIFDVSRGDAIVSLPDLFGPNSLDAPKGLDLLSYLISDPAFVYRRLSRGISFTMGGAPGISAAFGLTLGACIFWVFGALNAYLAVRFSKILEPQPLVFLAAAGAFIVVTTSIQMGRWDSIYSSASLLLYLVIVLGFLYKRGCPSSHSTARIHIRQE